MGMIEAQGELAKKAKDAYDKGDYMGAVQHGLNYLVPFIGQQTDQAGEQMKSGDIAGGIGRTLGVTAPMLAGNPEVRGAVTDAAGKTLDVASDVGSSAVRATAKGVNKALEKAPGTIGGAVGATAGGYLGGHVGAEVGGVAGAMAGRELLPQVRIPGEGFGLPNRVVGGETGVPEFQFQDPGAPLPEHPGIFSKVPLGPEAPSPELLQSKSLATGAVSPDEPAAALASLPVRAVHQAITELGPKASIEAVTARANQISKLGDLLNDAVGGKALKPGVPLKNQMDVVTPKESAPAVPEGHTPVKSSALQSYKYNPDAQEMETVSKNGQHYIHGDVSPEQAQSFMDGDFPGRKDGEPGSMGKAWNELRKNSTPVAKVINGQRVAVRPPTELQSATPEIPEVPAEGEPGAGSKGAKNNPPAKLEEGDLMQKLQKMLEDAQKKKKLVAQ